MTKKCGVKIPKESKAVWFRIFEEGIEIIPGNKISLYLRLCFAAIAKQWLELFAKICPAWIDKGKIKSMLEIVNYSLEELYDIISNQSISIELLDRFSDGLNEQETLDSKKSVGICFNDLKIILKNIKYTKNDIISKLMPLLKQLEQWKLWKEYCNTFFENYFTINDVQTNDFTELKNSLQNVANWNNLTYKNVNSQQIWEFCKQHNDQLALFHKMKDSTIFLAIWFVQSLFILFCPNSQFFCVFFLCVSKC